MEKVKLTKEVFNAFEHYSNTNILYNIEEMARESKNPGNINLKKIYDYYKSNPEEYFRAIVNGYDEEISPEQKAINLYREAEHEFKVASRNLDAEYWKGRKHGILDVLNILEINVQ